MERPRTEWADETILSTAYGIGIDRDGSLIVVDTLSHCVRRVSLDGRMTLVAGIGEPGYSGDTGPAIHARLNEPRAVAFGENGLLYISDGRNAAIRVITPNGRISTLKYQPAPSSVNEPERLRNPSFIRYDPNTRRLYIAESFRVRFIDADGMLHMFAGSGERFHGETGDGGPAVEAALGSLRDVIVKSDGTVLISQAEPPAIRQVLADGTLRTIFEPKDAIDESGAAITLRSVGGLALGPGERLYFTDFVTGHVYRWNANGRLTALTPSRRDNSGIGRHYWPWSLAITLQGDIYFSQFSLGRVRRIRTNGEIDVVAGAPQSHGDGGPALEARLFTPSDVAFDDYGAMYIADRDNAVVRRVDSTGRIERFAGNGEREDMAYSGAVARDTAIGFVTLVATSPGMVYYSGGRRVWSISVGGIFEYTLEVKSHKIAPPIGGFHFTPDGRRYVSNMMDDVIWRLGAEGSKAEKVAGGNESGFSGDGGPAIDAQLSFPTDLVTDRDGNLYFIDKGNRRIRCISGEGIITSVAGNGETAPAVNSGADALETTLYSPQGLAWGPDDSLYVSDGATIHRVVMPGRKSGTCMGPGARIFTIAGMPLPGFGGDGGPALDARLDTPRGIAFGPDGNLYIADSGNHRIRVLRKANPAHIPAQ